MAGNWYRDLFAIGSAADTAAVALRVVLAVGIPLIGGVLAGHPPAAVAGGATALFVTMCDIGTGGGPRLATMFAGWLAIMAGATLGHLLGTTPYAREAVVLLSAVVAGWASGSYPGIAAVTRFFAVAATASTGTHFDDPYALLAMTVAGGTALASILVGWDWFGIAPRDNVMDWRAGVRRALAGVDAGVRFTLCYAAAAAVALFAASFLRMQDPFWATLVVLMVMRREGVASIRLTIHYAVGTLAGVIVAALAFHPLDDPLLLAALATAVAAFIRVGFALNPALGFMGFTLFLLLVVHVAASGTGVSPNLLATRIYDVAVGCALSIIATAAATYPRADASPARRPNAPRLDLAGTREQAAAAGRPPEEP